MDTHELMKRTREKCFRINDCTYIHTYINPHIPERTHPPSRISLPTHHLSPTSIHNPTILVKYLHRHPCQKHKHATSRSHIPAYLSTHFSSTYPPLTLIIFFIILHFSFRLASPLKKSTSVIALEASVFSTLEIRSCVMRGL